MITAERARELLDYDPETGVFTWKVTLSNRSLKGSRAGSLHKRSGYLRVGADGKYYLAHRLVWLIHYGFFPDDCVDHINHDKADNRLCNLRAASPRDNSRNKKLRSDSPSGVCGVQVNVSGVQRGDTPWRVKIAGRRYGTYKTIEEAAVVAQRVYAGLGYHENHGAAP